MANLITSVQSIATQEYNVYVEPMLNNPTLKSLPFDFLYGNMPRELHFLGHTDKITGAKTACGWSFKGDGTTGTKKTLNPIELQANVEQCYTVLFKKLFGDKLPNGWKRGELSPEIIDFMQSEQMYALNRDLLSIAFLGDTDLTPDDYYSLLDGIYAKLLAGAVAVDGTVNAGAIVAADVDAGSFFDTMIAVYNSQARMLKQVPNSEKVWIWTQALYDAYLVYLQSSTQGTAGLIQTTYVTDGIMPKSFNGIPIVVIPLIDERLDTDFTTGSPAAAEYPYRCILTKGSNHVFLMDGDGLTSGNLYYDNDNDKVKLVGSYLLDYQYGFGPLNVIAGMGA